MNHNVHAMVKQGIRRYVLLHLKAVSRENLVVLHRQFSFSNVIAPCSNCNFTFEKKEQPADKYILIGQV